MGMWGRLSVVERAARAHFHGRHWLARAGRRAGGPGRVHQDAVAAGHPGRHLRGHRAVGDHPGRLVQDDRAAGVPDGAAAAPFRAGGLGGNDDRDPVLADLRHVRGARPRHLLRGVDAQVNCPASEVKVSGIRPGGPRLRAGAGRGGELGGGRVCGPGLGGPGPPAAAALARLGARVTVVDGRDDEERRRLAADLERLGATVQLGERSARGAALLAEIAPRGLDLVVTSPGWRPDAPLLAAAAAAGIPVMGDVEFAWRLRPVLPGGSRQEWLAVTGTNGKTTTVRMLAAMLAAAGHRSIAAGNVGTSAVEAVTEPEPYPVIAVELSSFQLHWSSTVRPLAAAVLNVAAHHLDWHGDIESYARDKGRIYAAGTIAICNGEDERSAALARAAPAAARVVAFRLGPPGPGELGIDDGGMVDREGGGVGKRG